MATVVADLADTPYVFVRALNSTEIVLQYGDTELFERWRASNRRNIATDVLRIHYNGRTYRFAGSITAERLAREEAKAAR